MGGTVHPGRDVAQRALTLAYHPGDPTTDRKGPSVLARLILAAVSVTLIVGAATGLHW